MIQSKLEFELQAAHYWITAAALDDDTMDRNVTRLAIMRAHEAVRRAIIEAKQPDAMRPMRRKPL